MSTIDDLTKEILADVVADFQAKRLDSDALSEEYVGVSIPALYSKYCTGGGAYSNVDFDLALKQLEAKQYVKTGPMVPYENPPGSSILVIAIFSKREFVYLTEKGYTAAQKSTSSQPRTPVPAVHISGGTFHQSPIGIANALNQSVNFNIDNDSEVIEYLSKLLSEQAPDAGEAGKKEVVELVTISKTGDLGKAKSVFQHLFGAAKETTKQLAWGVLTTYVSKQLGM